MNRIAQLPALSLLLLAVCLAFWPANGSAMTLGVLFMGCYDLFFHCRPALLPMSKSLAVSHGSKIFAGGKPDTILLQRSQGAALSDALDDASDSLGE